jgi:hypothetical protein
LTILKHDLSALANSLGEIGSQEMLKATADLYRRDDTGNKLLAVHLRQVHGDALPPERLRRGSVNVATQAHDCRAAAPQRKTVASALQQLELIAGQRGHSGAPLPAARRRAENW